MKNKIKIFIALGITLITTLIFTISTFAQVGYEITDNENIESLNLLDYNNRLTNKALDNNGNIVNNQYGAYVIDNIPLQANTTYTCNITSGGGLAQFDSNMNFISVINIITTQTFTTSNNATYFRMDATPNNTQPMLNIGNTLLDYFPYGNYINNENIVNNGELLSFYQYIIGNNYFNNSSITFNQSNNGTWINTNNSAVASKPLQTPNTTINENILQLSNLFNYTYNNAEALNNNLQYVHVYDAPNYSTSNYTYINIFPHYNLPSNVVLSGAMPLKYYNITINGSNYNGNIRIQCTEQGQNITNATYIDIERNVNGNYQIYYPDSNLYLNSIQIQTPYKNGSYQIPTTIISNVEITKVNNDYQIGYDTATSEYENQIKQIQEENTNLENQYRMIRANYEDLLNRYNNMGTNNELYTMVVGVAETPVNIFKQIFNFDILGINISTFVFGIISLLIIIWLIKKII